MITVRSKSTRSSTWSTTTTSSSWSQRTSNSKSNWTISCKCSLLNKVRDSQIWSWKKSMDKSSSMMRTKRTIGNNHFNRCRKAERARRMSPKTRPSWVKRAILLPWRAILKMRSVNSKNLTQKNIRNLIEKLEMCFIRSISQRWIMIHRHWARRSLKYWTMLSEPRKLQQKPRITRNYWRPCRNLNCCILQKLQLSSKRPIGS